MIRELKEENEKLKKELESGGGGSGGGGGGITKDDIMAKMKLKFMEEQLEAN